MPMLLEALAERGIDIAARDHTTAVVLSTGKVYIWGKNLWGVLNGDSRTSRCSVKLFEVNLAGVVVERISLGSWHVGLIGQNVEREDLKVLELEGTEDGENILEDIRNEVGECENPSSGVKSSGRIVYVAEMKPDNSRTDVLEKSKGCFDVIKSNEYDKPGYDDVGDQGSHTAKDYIRKKTATSDKLGLKKSATFDGFGNSKGNVTNFTAKAQKKKLSNFQRSKTFDAGEIRLVRSRETVDENNNVSSFVSISEEEGIMRQRIGKTARNTRDTRGSVSNKVTQVGPFITQFNSRKNTPSSATHRRLPTWNTESLLETGRSKSFWPQFSNSKIELEKPQTVATDLKPHASRPYSSVPLNQRTQLRRNISVSYLYLLLDISSNTSLRVDLF